MKLKNLIIRLQESYQDDAGKYVGKCEWEQKDTSEMKVVLPHEVSEKLLIFLAPVLEEYARTAAARMADSIVLSVNEARQLPETTV